LTFCRRKSERSGGIHAGRRRPATGTGGLRGPADLLSGWRVAFSSGLSPGGTCDATDQKI
jgi:hypothetical protein